MITISKSDQYVAFRHGNISLVFVHASNNYQQRRILWNDLLGIADPNTCILGDFNIVLGAHERSSGHITHTAPSEDFNNFISQRDLFDVEGTGNKYTWATRQNGIYMAARLDRALATQGFLNLWDEVELLILPMLCSDHSPLHLRVNNRVASSPRPFRFQNMWTQHDQFHSVVKENWYIPMQNMNPTLCLMLKLKRLRSKLKTWNLESSVTYTRKFNNS